jgi:transcription elongation factor GreA
MEHTLADAQIIDVTKINAEGNVVFGATVDLLNLDNDDNVSYQIVGEYEADIDKNLISISSPIARALIGKQEGDEVEVNAPGGIIEYEILEVRYI